MSSDSLIILGGVAIIFYILQNKQSPNIILIPDQHQQQQITTPMKEDIKEVIKIIEPEDPKGGKIIANTIQQKDNTNDLLQNIKDYETKKEKVINYKAEYLIEDRLPLLKKDILQKANKNLEDLYALSFTQYLLTYLPLLDYKEDLFYKKKFYNKLLSIINDIESGKIPKGEAAHFLIKYTEDNYEIEDIDSKKIDNIDFYNNKNFIFITTKKIGDITFSIFKRIGTEIYYLLGFSDIY